MHCHQCGIPLSDGEFIMLAVVSNKPHRVDEGVESVTVILCSQDCLLDLVASAVAWQHQQKEQT